MFIACLAREIRHKFVDFSQLAVREPIFPLNLGLRSQALKLQFINPDTPGHFLKPAMSRQEVMQIIESRYVADLPQPILHQAFIGESISMIYAPFYVHGRVFDSILDQPVSEELRPSFNIFSQPGGSPDWRINFTATLCPDCGWDLTGARDSLVLNCRNCHSVWWTKQGKLEKLTFGCLPPSGPDVIYLPFWRIKAKIRGMCLETYDDLAKIANLPRVSHKNRNAQRFHFWGPAFKVPAHILMRLMHHITMSQPQENLDKNLPRETIFPVNLPVEEVIESFIPCLAGIVRPRKLFLENLAHVYIKARKYLLVYVPFNVSHYEFVQPLYNLAVHRNTLKTAENL